MTMQITTTYLSVAGALMFSAAAFGIGSAVDTPRTLMSPDDYSVARRAIDADARLRLADVARGEQRVRKAELDLRYHGTVSAAADMRLARAKSGFDIAKARCGGSPEDARDQCLQSARSAKAKAVADARLAAI
jgi:hypothetical protein